MLKRIDLQLGFRTDPMFAYIIVRLQANNTRKKTKGNHNNSFVYMGSHGAPRTHAYEERSGEVRPGLCERERERVHNYLELPNNSRSFSYLFLLKNLLRHRMSVHPS